MIDEAEALLLRASAVGAIGRYQLEGALQSAHVYRRRTGHANWAAVVQLYDALLALSGSPVVAINRALAIAELHGATAALEAMHEVADDVRLTEYQPYWAARAELLPRSAHTAKPAMRIKSQSVSSATPRSAASCSSVSRPWCLDPTRYQLGEPSPTTVPQARVPDLPAAFSLLKLVEDLRFRLHEPAERVQAVGQTVQLSLPSES
jgi:hypothetical protein